MGQPFANLGHEPANGHENRGGHTDPCVRVRDSWTAPLLKRNGAGRLTGSLRDGHNRGMDRETFARLVREALAHLYDEAYLESHPLAELLIPTTEAPEGASLHRLLLQAIESLRPAPHVPSTAPLWRPYLALSLRYVEGLQARQVAQEMHISPRQFRREQVEGLRLLTERLWARYSRAQAQQGKTATSAALLDAEVARMSAAPGTGLTDVNATLASVLVTLQELIARQGMTVQVTAPESLPLVACDRVVLRQIILSVLSHVLHDARAGAIHIELAAKEPFVDLTVVGAGAAATAARSPEDRLAIAGHLLAAQGGEIELAANPPGTIRLRLPARTPPIVLIVDDNSDVIQLFRRYLSASPYQMVGATSSQEALRMAQTLKPAAISLDVMMPTQDGWEVLQNLKHHPATREIPIIVCSVLRERELALSLGAADFLAKPVTQEMLLHALARVMKAARSR